MPVRKGLEKGELRGRKSSEQGKDEVRGIRKAAAFSTNVLREKMHTIS